MKKILILILALALCGGVAAQLPEVSTNVDVWYYISSGHPQYLNRCIVDINEPGTGVAKFEVRQKSSDTSEHSQQWKLIRPVNATSKNVHFVNRLTGNIIQTEYDFNGYYHAQSTTDITKSNGWNMQVISGRNQIKISGVNASGEIGYLNVSSESNDPEWIPLEDADFVNSFYSWTFSKVDPNVSSIHEKDLFEDVELYVQDRRIVVENVDDYKIYHISGVEVQKNTMLPVGVYIVRIQGQSRSILVK